MAAEGWKDSVVASSEAQVGEGEIMKRMLGVLVLACMVGLSVAGCSQPAATSPTSSSPAQRPASQNAAPTSSAATTSQAPSEAPAGSAPTSQEGQAVATMAKFNKVKKGMHLAEVVKLMGGPGTKIGEGSSGNLTVSMYGWYGADPTNVMVVSFHNGAVDSKRQQGLQ